MMKRRDFLKTMGALSSASMLSACGKKGEPEKLISYLVPPEEGVIPGEAVFTPSTCAECPAHCGIRVKSIDGLPKKVEGNPGHPVNDGGLCMRGQATLFRLYHPDRIQTPLARSAAGGFHPLSWEQALKRIASAHRTQGRKMNLYLSGRTTGTLSRMIDQFCADTGTERLPEFEPYSHGALRKAYRTLFRIDDLPSYRINKADFLLTLGADILETFLSPVSFAGQVSSRKSDASFSWTHIEPHLSLTGMNATERLTLKPGSETTLLHFLLRTVLKEKKEPTPETERLRTLLPPLPLREVALLTGLKREEIHRLAKRLAGARRPLLIAGGVSTAQEEGLQVALLAVLLQGVLDMDHSTVDFSRSMNYSRVGTLHDMTNLIHSLKGEEVGVLFLSRTNPIHALAPRYRLRENLKKADLIVGLGDLMDETLHEADLILPLSHPIESWGDAEPRRGIYSLIRPAMPPQYDTLPEGEILLRLSGRPQPGSYGENLPAFWRTRFGEKGTAEFLQKGYREIPVPEWKGSLDLTAAGRLDFQRMGRPLDEPVLIVTPSIRTFDGRSRSLPLLYEIPDPLTTITYGSWVSLSGSSAAEAGLQEKEEVVIKAPDGPATLTVKIQPGLPEGILMVQGDLWGGPPLPDVEDSGEILQVLEKVSIEKTGTTALLPILSGSLSQHGRGLIPMGNGEHHKGASLYPAHEHREYRWAMAVDLDRCIGCAACVAACYIENNVPIVGRKEHLKGREMSWLRIEPYYNNGKVDFLPMMCQQCDDAPCETVCPVYAAYHNPEGLNIQVYNRCVGTRYCSNNCPYKVRRFNWFEHRRKPPLDRLYNPEMFVRGKGIMEKCSFCIQRIRKAHDTAKDEGRKIRDGEVIPACGESCPARAITFGNLLDPGSEVYRLAHSDRAYRVFEGLGTKPSVYYLKKPPQGI